MNIVFVCSGNTCRSPMAEALLRAELARRRVAGIGVSSAGLFAREGEPASALAVAAAADCGADVSGHRSRPISRAIIGDSTLLCVTEDIKERVAERFGGEGVYSLSGFIGAPRDVPDPYGGSPEDYASSARALSDIAREIADICAASDGRNREPAPPPHIGASDRYLL